MAAAVFLAAAGAAAESSGALREQAETALEEGKFGPARRLIALALEKPQSDDVAVVRLLLVSARIGKESGHYREADVAARHALDIAAIFPLDDPLRGAAFTCAGSTANALGDFERAETLLNKGVELLRVADGEREWLLRGLIELALIGRVHGDFAASDEWLRQFHQLAGTSDPLVARARIVAADSRLEQGRYAEAESELRAALQLRQSQCGHDHPDIAMILAWLARARRFADDYATAEALARDAERIDRMQQQDAPLLVERDRTELAGLHHSRGEYREAIALYRSIVANETPELGADHPTIAWCHSMMADSWRGLSEYANGRREIDALRSREAHYRPDDPARIDTLRVLARSEREQGDFTSARTHMRQALEIDLRRDPKGAIVASDAEWLAATAEWQLDYETQEAYLDLALKVRVASQGWSTAATSSTLITLAFCRLNQGAVEDARQLLDAALAVAQSCEGWRAPAVANVLRNMAALERHASGDFDCAEAMARSAIDIYTSRTDAVTHAVHYVATRNLLADIQSSRGDHALSIAEHEEVVTTAEEMFGPTAEQTAVYLHNLALEYVTAHQLHEAYVRYELAMVIFEQHGLLANTIATLGQLADVENTMANELGDGKDDEAAHLRASAIVHLRDALRRGEEGFGSPLHPGLYGTLTALASIYASRDQYDQALPLRQRALEITEADRSHTVKRLTRDLVLLGEDERYQHRYADARRHFEAALKLDLPTADAEEIVPDYSHLADIYGDASDYVHQKESLLWALHWSTDTTWPSHASLYNDLSVVQRQFDVPEAIRLARKAMELAVASGEDDVYSYAEVSLANALSDQKETYADAEVLYRGTLLDDQKNGLADSPTDDYVTDLANLALFYASRGRCEEARPPYEEALADWNKLHPDDSDPTLLSNIASFYEDIGESRKSIDAFRLLMRKTEKTVEEQSPFLTEDQRLSLQHSYQADIEAFLSASVDPSQTDPALRAELFDMVLWHKANVVRALARARKAVITTGSPARIALLDRLRRDTGRLTALMSASAAAGDSKIEQLRTDISTEEEQLFQNLVLPPPVRATWKDVQSRLEPGAAAVEIVRFHDYRGANRTGDGRYVALIITPEMREAPDLVQLGTSNFIESKVLADFDALQAGRSGAGMLLAETLWKPIARRIGAAKRVYVSADGSLASLTWDIIPSEHGALIDDDVDVRVLTSTADLLDDVERSDENKSAVLVGNIDFGPRVHEPGSPRLRPLPGTRAEIDTIHTILGSRGWTVTKLERDAATASALAELRSPRVLHLATHSFVRRRAGDDATTSDLGASGLFLAGANRPAQSSSRDHLLTAATARYLDLAGTELVVLAACESAGGSVRSGEGVFGLPRSMIEAGAQSVMMTLWRVPDRDSQRILTAFYRYWSEGADKHEALRHALRDAKKRKFVWEFAGPHPWLPLHRNAPYYWGAFVLVGR